MKNNGRHRDVQLPYVCLHIVHFHRSPLVQTLYSYVREHTTDMLTNLLHPLGKTKVDIDK